MSIHYISRDAEKKNKNIQRDDEIKMGRTVNEQKRELIFLPR